MAAHALLSPSSAHRWTRCPGSVPFTKNMAEESSEYAREGTLAHAFAAALLTKCGASAAVFAIREAGYDPDVMREYVDEYVNYVLSLQGYEELLVEQRLDLSPITGEPGAFGTADAVVINDKRLHIVDLKYGQGERVNAVDNPQLLLYAAAALETFDALGPFEEVEVHIVQPRLSHISSEAIAIDDFKERVEAIKAAASYALDTLKQPCDEWHFNPHARTCKYCKGRGFCRAYARYSMSAAGVEPPASAGAPYLTAEELAVCYARLDTIEQWVDAIRSETLERLFNGDPVPGYKLVSGREGIRKWSSDDEADKVLRRAHLKVDERYVRKVISPTAVDKLVKSGRIDTATHEKLSALVTRAPGKPTIVPASDKRPAYTATNADQYPNETI